MAGLAFTFSMSAAPGGGNAPRPAEGAVSRRAALRLATLAAAGVAFGLPDVRPAEALRLGKPSTSELLRGMQSDKTEEEIEEEKAARAEAKRQRLARQNELMAEAERKKTEGVVAQESEAEIEANLRANYYYPTARKRYLPRIKRALEDLPQATELVRSKRWADAETFIVDGYVGDCHMPMRLYASSLAGQGLSLAAKFVQRMASDADDVENSVKKLKKALKKRDESEALAQLDEIKSSVSAFRHVYGTQASYALSPNPFALFLTVLAKCHVLPRCGSDRFVPVDCRARTLPSGHRLQASVRAAG